VIVKYIVLRRLVAFLAGVTLALGLIGGAGAASAAAALQPQTPEQQDEFIPISELPPQEQYPAGRLVVIAYIFVPVVLFLYLLSLSRRMAAVHRDVERLEADMKRSGRA
jgi:hypothetical protein